MKNLRVSLISSRLKKADCVVLAKRIAFKAKSWACKVLPYAGRLQLINSNLTYKWSRFNSKIFLM